jgi:hypothetical protein
LHSIARCWIDHTTGEGRLALDGIFSREIFAKKGGCHGAKDEGQKGAKDGRKEEMVR